MKTILIAGEQGTSLGAFTSNQPKPRSCQPIQLWTTSFPRLPTIACGLA